MQSLHDPTLRVLGRIHTAAEAYASFNDARAVGFESINLDFIFGLPGQTVAQWEETLREIVTWGADHFALYSLILEERTPLYAQVTSGRISVPDDDVDRCDVRTGNRTLRRRRVRPVRDQQLGAR
ncbi:MAG: hypothetical protein RMJ48_08835 [Roseiflexaceae bacterium]|nr:hypothetical protein [Roseiflexaceae bacterium]